MSQLLRGCGRLAACWIAARGRRCQGLSRCLNRSPNLGLNFSLDLSLHLISCCNRGSRSRLRSSRGLGRCGSRCLRCSRSRDAWRHPGEVALMEDPDNCEGHDSALKPRLGVLLGRRLAVDQVVVTCAAAPILELAIACAVECGAQLCSVVPPDAPTPRYRGSRPATGP